MGLDNPIHIAFLLILLLLVFGAKRLPEMGKSLGSGMRGFKDALSGEAEEHHPTTETQTVAVAPALVAVHQQEAVTTAQPVAVHVPETVVREKLPA